MRIVVALGGNALLRRGEPLTAERQRENVRRACQALAPLTAQHELVISHGNGPQVGLLALQAAAYADVDPYPLDILGAQTEGMIGYVIEQELGNLLPFEKHIATILTMVEVDPTDPAFQHPTKFVGPVYDEAEARRVQVDKKWTIARDGQYWRRVVPSPRPTRIFEVEQIKLLLGGGCVVICTGGGGIPTMYAPGTRTLVGAEAVIDKDLATAVLAADLCAHLMLLATDEDAVYTDWGTPQQRAIRRIHPDVLSQMDFAAGSMGPKVEAAVTFATQAPHGATAIIGSLDRISDILARRSGTSVTTAAGPEIEYW